MEENAKIYFDNGSTSWPKAPGVAEAVGRLLTEGAFNINRGNYEGAYEVEAAVLDTREQLARLFHAENSRRVIFTPGITHSLNYFIRGFLKRGDHVLVTGMEHNAVMRLCGVWRRRELPGSASPRTEREMCAPLTWRG
mgnify:CR=1 FL=1